MGMELCCLWIYCVFQIGDVFQRFGICDIFLAFFFAVPALNILFLNIIPETTKSISSLDLICCQHRICILFYVMLLPFLAAQIVYTEISSKTPVLACSFMLLPFSFCWSCFWSVWILIWSRGLYADIMFCFLWSLYARVQHVWIHHLLILARGGVSNQAPRWHMDSTWLKGNLAMTWRTTM